MKVPPPATHVNPYVARLNQIRIGSNNFLIQSVISGITAQAPEQPQFAFGSDASQFQALGHTIDTLKSAYNSGLYGYEKGWTGTHLDRKA